MENLNVALVSRGLNWASTVKWKSVLQDRSYINSVTDENITTVTQEELNAYDLVVNTYECLNAAQQSILRGLTVPVLNLNPRAYSELKIGLGWTIDYNGTDIQIVDNTHPITEIYDLDEEVTVQEPTWLAGVRNPPADMDVLAEPKSRSSYESLGVMEIGAKFLDDFVNTAKFAHWSGNYYIDATHDITADGLTLLDRIISWLMGEYDAKILTIQSSGASGVSIAVSPLDVDGAGDGETNFTRRYDSGTEVTLIAPATVGDLFFQKWTYLDVDSFDRTKVITTAGEDKTTTATYIPLDYVDVIKFDVPKRNKDFKVSKRAKSFSVPKRNKDFKVERV